MYVSPAFRNTNLAQSRELIEQNGFGILVSQVNDKPWATHLPMQLGISANGEEVLTGHLSKGNAQWKNFTDGMAVLAIFQGPHGYISSSWYDHENVPTWNYIAVHVYGNIRIITGDALLAALTKLVNKYEAGSRNPVTVEGMSPSFLEAQVKGIVGFEIDITEIQAAYKLSQNRDEKNLHNIISELEQRGDEQSLAMAAAMRKHHPR